jgi:N-acetylneuraminate synthase
MTTLNEIKNSLSLLAQGYSDSLALPKIENGVVVELDNSEITKILKGRVTLLHAVSLYPTPAYLSNVRNIELLKKEFGLVVGLSDHSSSHVSSILAIGMGAEVFEKHFTLDKSMPGPDHKASMSVEEMREWIKILNESAVRFGDLNRIISKEELEVRQVVRQHLIASRVIKFGEKFSLENLTFTRTGGFGNQTSEVWRLLNEPASRSYNVGDPIDE